jgi:DNA modification methylase
VDSPEWTGAIWEFSGASKKKIGHPAPFPIELPKRCIKLFSYVGNTVLDPFVGSGATLLACRQTDRVGIGIDIDEKYCELAVRRLFNEGKINQFMMKVSEKAQEKERKRCKPTSCRFPGRLVEERPKPSTSRRMAWQAASSDK